MTTPHEQAALESLEQDCGVCRVQALYQGGVSLLDRVDKALWLADRHFERIRAGELPLSPAVAREIRSAIREAREMLGVGPEQ